MAAMMLQPPGVPGGGSVEHCMTWCAGGAERVLVGEVGGVGGEEDGEAGVGDVPAHDVLGVSVEGGAGGDDAGTGVLDAGGLLCQGGVGTGDEDGGGAHLRRGRRR